MNERKIKTNSEQPKDELPIMECQRVPVGDGTERFQFVCPKCGKTRTHGASEGFRMSHCFGPIDINDKGEIYRSGLPCWPKGYILKERNGR